MLGGLLSESAAIESARLVFHVACFGLVMIGKMEVERTRVMICRNRQKAKNMANSILSPL